jgi:hypothetical protein
MGLTSSCLRCSTAWDVTTRKTATTITHTSVEPCPYGMCFWTRSQRGVGYTSSVFASWNKGGSDTINETPQPVGGIWSMSTFAAESYARNGSMRLPRTTVAFGGVSTIAVVKLVPDSVEAADLLRVNQLLASNCAS